MDITDFAANANDISYDDLGHRVRLADIRGVSEGVGFNGGSQSRIEDIFSICSDTSVHVQKLAGLVRAQQQQIMFLTQQMDNLMSKVGRTEAIVSNTIQEQVEEVKKGTDTRQVSDRVPAAIIVSLWHKYNTALLPVKFKYLTDLCGICFGTMDPGMKSDMGISLRMYLSDIDISTNTGSTMMTSICTSASKSSIEMKRHLLDTITRLGTIYAFMLPFELSSLLNRVENITGDEFLLRASPDEKTMVHPHGGFNMVSTAFMYEKRIIRAMKNACNTGHNKHKAIALCKHIENHSIDEEGKYTGAGRTIKLSRLNAMGVIQSTSVSEIDNSLGGLTMADLFSPVKLT